MNDAIAHWRPALGVFIKRCVWVGIATLVLFGGFGVFTGFWQIIIAAPVLIIAYTFLFDEHLKWMTARHNAWELTPTELLHVGYEGTSTVPLSDIDSTSTRFGWTVIVRLQNGLKIEMAYVQSPQKIADQIMAARAKLVPKEGQI